MSGEIIDKQLTQSTLFETRDDPETGQILEAVWFVDCTDGYTYRLGAMTPEAYAAWYLEKTHETSSDEDVPPLVVPHDFDREGIVTHVERSYLDPDQPDRINNVAHYLLKVSERGQ